MPSGRTLVVGGGIVGLACARALGQRGAEVLLFEPGPLAGAASPASAGMLAAQVEAERDETLLALGVLARDTCLRVARELEEETGVQVALAQTGVAHIARTEAEEHTLKAAVARQRQLGLRSDWLDRDELQRRWPGIARDARGASFAPEDGALDPEALLSALRLGGERASVRRVSERVTGLDLAAKRVRGVVTERGRHEGDHVLVAAGAWSPGLRGLPRPLPVQPIRGQMAALTWPSETPGGVLFVHGGYVLQRGNEALVGSTMEPAGFDPSVTPEGLAHLRGVSRTVFPDLASAPLLRSWAGLRPVTPDGLPILGRDPVIEGLWYATGHGRNGILFAALTGEILTSLVLDGATDVDITACHPGRFGPEE